MKVLDLACGAGHVFEGWFGSESDFQDQLVSGLVECPQCGDRQIEKRLSAPRLNLGANGQSEPVTTPTRGDTAALAGREPVSPNWQAMVMQAMREIAARTEDVGQRFADEARRIHHGEVAARGIRGQASLAQAQELLEEGIAVLPLPDLPILKGPVH